VADRLGPYRSKRDFAHTTEPSGREADGSQSPEPRFVVQRHRARRLHYDLRLEVDGALVSWAVPKGPTLDPTVRRAAFHVEDHPLEYLNFEGVIPAGQYGGGDVIVWDTGAWIARGAATRSGPRAALEAGELHFDLCGHKLAGRFALVRSGTDDRGTERWLLVHKRDRHAVSGWDPEAYPRSVLSGRTNDEVREDPGYIWRSDLPPQVASMRLSGAAPLASDADELRDLEGLRSSGTWEIFGRKVRLTNLDKVIFPSRPGEPPATKRDLVRYAARVAPVVLPYLSGRALNMHRFPSGVESKGFWQKQLPVSAPAWISRWEGPDADRGEVHTHLVVDEPATLVWAANLGVIEWHAWTSLAVHPQQPTYVLIDLDPGADTDWGTLLTLARLYRTALEHLGIRGQPKLTGHRGIHIWIPIGPGYDFADTRAWAEGLSRAIGAVVPDLVSRKWRVEDRQGRARLDYTQNAINKTLVAPYSPRPAPGAPVSAPIAWDELDDPSLAPDGFTIRTIVDRIAAKGDLFGPILRQDQDLPPLT
jgi:bifunctional non-homologous end joining protein LigD